MIEKLPTKATVATAAALWLTGLGLTACGEDNEQSESLTIGVTCPPAAEPLISQRHQVKDGVIRFWFTCKGEGRFMYPDNDGWITPRLPGFIPFGQPANFYSNLISVDYNPSPNDNGNGSALLAHHRELEQVTISGVDAINSIEVKQAPPAPREK